jgi:hypothetical protein
LIRHPEVLAPLGASLEGRRPRLCLLHACGGASADPSFEGRARARPPQDDGMWIDMTGTCFSIQLFTRSLQK